MKSMKALILLLIVFVFSISCSTSSNDEEIEIEFGTVTDVEGNSYKTVMIGNQEWMAQSLVTRLYRDGSEIVYDNLFQASEFSEFGFNELGAWTYYINDGSIVYNVLYNWYAINDNRGLCPSGWEIPSKGDWDLLIEYLGENPGGKLKDTDIWESPNSGASNTTGFSAKPTGMFFDTGTGVFINEGYIGYWWSSTLNSNNSDEVIGKSMSFESKDVLEDTFDKEDGIAVRCIKSS